MVQVRKPLRLREAKRKAPSPAQASKGPWDVKAFLHGAVFLVIAIALAAVDGKSLWSIFLWQGSVVSIGNTGFGLAVALSAVLLVKYLLDPSVMSVWVEYLLRFLVLTAYGLLSLVAFHLGDAFPDQVEARSKELVAQRRSAIKILNDAMIKTVEQQRAQLKVSINTYQSLVDGEERRGGCGKLCKQFKNRLLPITAELSAIQDLAEIRDPPLPEPFGELNLTKRNAFNDALARTDTILASATTSLTQRREKILRTKPQVLTDSDLTAEAREQARVDLAAIADDVQSPLQPGATDRLNAGDEPAAGPTELVHFVQKRPFAAIPIGLLYIELLIAWRRRRATTGRRPATAELMDVWPSWCGKQGQASIAGADAWLEALDTPQLPGPGWLLGLLAPSGLPALAIRKGTLAAGILLRHVLPLLEQYAETARGDRAHFAALIRPRRGGYEIDRSLLPALRHPALLRALFADFAEHGPAKPVVPSPAPLPDRTSAIVDLTSLPPSGSNALTDDEHLALAEELETIPLASQLAVADRVVAFHLMAARQASHAGRLAQVRRHLAALRHLSEASQPLRHTFGPDLMEAAVVEANAFGDLLQFAAAAKGLELTYRAASQESAGASWYKAASAIGHLKLLAGKHADGKKYLDKALAGLVGAERAQPLIHRIDATIRAGGPERDFHRDVAEVRQLLSLALVAPEHVARSRVFLNLQFARAAAVRPTWLTQRELEAVLAENRICSRDNCHYARELTTYYCAYAELQGQHNREALALALPLMDHLLEVIPAAPTSGHALSVLDVLRLAMLCGLTALAHGLKPAEAVQRRTRSMDLQPGPGAVGGPQGPDQRRLTELWDELQQVLKTMPPGPEVDVKGPVALLNRTGYLWWPSAEPRE